jgi:LacI family transcriptional regulator
MPHVALCLPTSIMGSRDLLRGVLSYINLHGHWAVDLIDERNPRLEHLDPAAWGYSGMIVDMRDRRQAERLLSAGCPAVVTCVPDEILAHGHPCARLSRIECENDVIGCKAAEFLLERKFTAFAFVGDVSGAGWAIKRQNAFCRRLLRSGFRCDVYPPSSKSEQQDFSKEKMRLRAWLKALPKPAALFAANDARARQVLETCLKADVSVPQEIAVLGVDNDELICETTQPQLSSIQMSTEQAGFEAARVLDRMMRGNTRRPARQK